MQPAYRPGHSMETVLLRIQDDINRGLNAGVGSLLVLLDLSVAFNTIDHTILLEHLEAVADIQGAALAWLRSYLHDKTQSVIINGVQSTTVDLSIGVSQGLVLDPLLFLVYVISLHSVIEHHPEVRHHSYADDRQLYIQFYLLDQDSYRHALQWLAMCVEEDRVWLLTNKLKLNTDKTVHVHHDSALPDHLPSAAASCERWWHQRACSVLPPQPWHHHGLHHGHAWPDPEHQVHHVPSPAHHPQHQTLHGQGHFSQGHAVLGLTTVTLCWWASLPLHSWDCSWPRTMPLA